jgi:hypothetical protein
MFRGHTISSFSTKPQMQDRRCFSYARYHASVRSVHPHTLMHTISMPLPSLCGPKLTPHIAEQVVLSSSEVLLGSRSWRRWCAFTHRAGMAPSSKLFLLLRNGRGSMSCNRAGVTPAAEIVFILHRLWCLNRLRLRWCRCRGWCWIRLRPGVIVTPWVAVSSRD